MRQILDGTWRSSPPEEVLWAELMRAYGWSWDELQSTPTYMLRVCADWMSARNRAEQEAARG